MKEKLTQDQRVIYAVGAIAICCHEIEQSFKLIVPFTDSSDPSLSAILRRRDKLSKKPLGDVAELFFKAASGDVEPLQALVKSVIDKRNGLIHHFYEIYGARISEGQHEAVIAELKAQHEETVSLLMMLREASVDLLEILRDTIFRDTEHYKELAVACAKARARLNG